MFADPTVTPGYIISTTQAKLVAFRRAMSDIQELAHWSAGVATTDLVALGMAQATAQTLLSAIADAAAVVTINTTGQPPSAYPQAASTYVYANSQRQVIGPQ